MQRMKRITCIAISILIVVSAISTNTYAAENEPVLDKIDISKNVIEDINIDEHSNQDVVDLNDSSDGAASEKPVESTDETYEAKQDEFDRNELLEASDVQDDENGEDVIEVRTAEDFYNIRYNLSGNYELINDIDLSEETSSGGIYNNNGLGWEPIGADPDEPFEGVLDGNGHSVIGIHSSFDGGVGGVFGYNNGSIKNLNCSGGQITFLNTNTGGIVGVNNKSGKIEYCDNSNKIEFISLDTWKKWNTDKQNRYDALEEVYIGGVVGANHGTVDACINYGAFEMNSGYLSRKTKPNIGGIAGYNDLAVANSVNNNSIIIQTNYDTYSGYCQIGGIAGISKGGLLGGDTNNAKIECLSGSYSKLGGICGKAENTSIFKSKNTSEADLKMDKGSAESSLTFEIGGICGETDSKSTISECVNGGLISSQGIEELASRCYYAGGIAGISSADIYYSTNIGMISFGNDDLKGSSVGGITGATPAEVSNCCNTGDILINSKNTVYYRTHFGGIVGNAYSNAFICYCSNDGQVNIETLGHSYVGGLVGALRDSSMLSQCYNTGAVSLTATGSSTSTSIKEEGVGGLAGTLYDNSILWNAYNTGKVSSKTALSNWDGVGGITGGCQGGILGNVYNIGVISLNNGYGGSILGYFDSGDLIGGCIGGDWTAKHIVRKFANDYSLSETLKKYYYMCKKETYDNFNFEETWTFGNGSYSFPVLKNMTDLDYQQEIELPIKLINSSDADIWAEGYTGDVIDKETGEVISRGSIIPMLKKDISSATVGGIVDKPYSGLPATQTVQVELEGENLTENVDYYCTYGNNVAPGTATIIINGMGKYEGKIEKTFGIIAPPAPPAPTEYNDLPSVKIKKPKAAKKKITVKWKKVSKKNMKAISGIQIQVATDPGFINIVSSTTAGKKKASKTIKGLQSKVTYYVRIRAYAAGNHYSFWATKAVKVK